LRYHNQEEVLYSYFKLVTPVRLSEFEATASGSLTAEEFESVDLEEESNPPAFTNARKKDKKLLEKKTDEPQEDEIEEELTSSKKRRKTSDTDNIDDLLQVNSLPAEEIEKELEETLNSEAFREMEEDEMRRRRVEADAGIITITIHRGM
jgi:hypothetical protein